VSISGCVPRPRAYAGNRFTTKEFDELCFEYGIELDEDVRNRTGRTHSLR